jgi:hypothetical protein
MPPDWWLLMKEGVKMPDIMHDTPRDTGPGAPVDSELLVRQQAIK